MSNVNHSHTPVSAIKHDDDKRAAIPTTELAGEESMAAADKSPQGQYAQFRHDFTRGRDPEIYWLGKYRNDDEATQSADLRVDTRSLYVHEDIQPEMLINQLYRLRETTDWQHNLFGDELPKAAYEDELERITHYYKHSVDWKNRLIQGDSLLVMNSLLQREGMAGKVQCVYIDPPYGIKYGSNWQMKLNNRDVKDNDESLSGEPEMIKAFRDTWELGIHSYLSYLRDRLICARELLNESGSCFVQISDENVHLVRSLMDEVFGCENFVNQIVYTKTSGLTTNALASIADYILWYAKDAEKLKVRKLFVDKLNEDDLKFYNKVELSNGERMSLSEWEKQSKTTFSLTNPPKDVRLYTSGSAFSQGASNNPQPFVFEGQTYFPPTGNHWKAKYPEGMNRLVALNRLFRTPQNTLRYIRYYDDFPLAEISNIWFDTAIGGFQSDKLYVVQSGTKAIQRCILMTTDPGDLVLDPTCGSGTTAYVAEQWGRRWITMDTSRIALNIAKKRLSTAVFPYYKLFDTEHGNIRQGFIYKTVPHITLKSLANDLPAEQEILYDQPETDKKKLRVSGPFTVETLQAFNVTDPDQMDSGEAQEVSNFQERIFAHLKANGVRNGAKNEQALFYNIEALADPYLNAKGCYRDGNGNEHLAYFHIGPKFGTVSRRAVNEAMKQFRTKLSEGASWLILLGFSFEDNINEKDYNVGSYVVSKVRMHDDLMQDGLLKKDRGAGSFITIGEPDIVLVDDDAQHCHAEIRGLDIYDPIKDIVKPRSVDDIAYWEIDDDYDEQHFVVRGLYFCGGDKKEFASWRKGLESAAKDKARQRAENTLRIELVEELWDRLYSFTSAPIEKRPGRKIAVRVVSQFGEESTKMLTIK